MGKIFIFSSTPAEREFLFNLAHERGIVYTSPTIEKAVSLLSSSSFDLAIVEIETAGRSPLPELLAKVPCLLLVGDREDRLKEAVRSYPSDRFVDYLLFTGKPEDQARAKRVLTIAHEYGRLKNDVEALSKSKASTEDKLRQVYAEIKSVGSALSEGLVKELEKRVALEARYIRTQKLNQQFENVLRKLYAATDVNNLLDTIPDIKEIVRAGSISLYLLEDNDTLGTYLKPLVWDQSYLTHSDFTRHVALLPSLDFASNVARSGTEIALADASGDPRFSSRYRRLSAPLRSLLCVPLKSISEIIGVIEVYNKVGTPAVFSAEDAQILRGLSEHIALAMTKLNLIQYDALTGLLRPDPFFEKVIQQVEQFSKRRKETGTFAMVMGDVDWFKHYNDRNGQEAGNRLLRDLAVTMKSAIREDDLLCRYGGEEFLFFLGSVNSIEEATLLTERIRKAVEDRFFEYQEFQPRRNLTMSFGVTLFPPEQIGLAPSKLSLKKITAEAELALAEAKGKRQAALGIVDSKRVYKNRVCAYVRDKAAVISKTSLLNTVSNKPATEKRRDPRFFTSTLCLCRENGGHRVFGTIDMSAGGARISSDMRIAKDRVLDLLIILGQKANPFRADVVHSEKASAQSAFYHTGIRFRDLTSADRQALQNYFSALGQKGSPLA
ncbi:MAG: diguanylate cyclase [Candidatus Aminicenantes bacterium]|nr:diguanylate cyclase [Candidatus Aminicenantes bacterium]